MSGSSENTLLELLAEAETAEKIAPWVDGYYLMTPFQRIDLIEEIMRGLGR